MKLRANVRPQWQWAKLKQLLAIVLMFWGTISMYGQSKMISGIVQSESDGEPLVGATVIVKETKAGGTTDLNGRYSVQAGQGQTLIVSYIGYRSKEIKVGKNSRIDVQLQEDNEMLDEVVVVGYGTMKRSDLTGSVVSVTGDELKKSVVTSLDQALQGRAAGVQVTQNSGTPGGGISVSIRGINSLNGNEPLYVIDGGLVGLVDIAIVDIDGKGCSLFIPGTTALNVNQAIIVVILNSNRRGTNCKCRVVELQTRRIGREFIACPRFKREREVANDAFV